jgi:PTS system nitrogen regulatory IIA component
MNISDILSPERISCAASPASKKRALEEIGALMLNADASLTQGEIFDSLLSRERLGSTGLGHGVAIPHGRVNSASTTIGAFLQLAQGIDFDAIDGQPVDLIFGLLVPAESTEEHLQVLAQLAKMFSDEVFCEKLRHANNSEELYNLLSNWQSATE